MEAMLEAAQAKLRLSEEAAQASRTAGLRVETVSEKAAAARARGTASSGRTAQLDEAAVIASLEVREAQFEVRGEMVWESEQQAETAEEMAEFNEAVANNRTRFARDEAREARVTGTVGGAAGFDRARVKSAYTVNSDLGGDLSLGMSAGEKPVCFIEGLPWSAVVTTRLTDCPVNMLLASDQLRLEPVGPKTSVHMARTTRSLEVHLQTLNDLVGSVQGKSEKWTTVPLCYDGSATLPNGFAATDWVTPSTDAEALSLGCPTGAHTSITRDSARWKAAV